MRGCCCELFWLRNRYFLVVMRDFKHGINKIAMNKWHVLVRYFCAKRFKTARSVSGCKPFIGFLIKLYLMAALFQYVIDAKYCAFSSCFVTSLSLRAAEMTVREVVKFLILGLLLFYLETLISKFSSLWCLYVGLVEFELSHNIKSLHNMGDDGAVLFWCNCMLEVPCGSCAVCLFGRCAEEPIHGRRSVVHPSTVKELH